LPQAGIKAKFAAMTRSRIFSDFCGGVPPAGKQRVTNGMAESIARNPEIFVICRP
jgi:hypothetical protein